MNQYQISSFGILLSVHRFYTGIKVISIPLTPAPYTTYFLMMIRYIDYVEVVHFSFYPYSIPNHHIISPIIIKLIRVINPNGTASIITSKRRISWL